MKKKIICLLLLGTLFVNVDANALVSKNNAESKNTIILTNEEKAKTEAFVVRLNEIKEMDKSNLTSAEKKVLRKEVRTIKAEIAKSSGGIYLSVGAILLVVLLLILLL